MSWPVVVLLFLAPAIGEALSGSSPPVAFFNPVILLYQAGLYGSGAILARELVRRHALGSNGRFLDTNWIWATALTMFHSVFSITISVLLVETAFRDERPWLRNWALWFFVAVLAAVSLYGFYGFGFVTFKKQGYTHPPATWLGALLLAVALVWLGLRRRSRPTPASVQPPPGLWSLRLTALVLTLLWFIGLWVIPSWIHVGIVPVVELALVAVTAAVLLKSWSSRPGWDRRHRLALASGALAFLIAFTPVAEAGGKRGMVLVGLGFLGLLVWLRHRAETVLPDDRLAAAEV
jgi:hypothetical protein